MLLSSHEILGCMQITVSYCTMPCTLVGMRQSSRRILIKQRRIILPLHALPINAKTKSKHYTEETVADSSTYFAVLLV
jgi:hypothetical protein